ncbi:MAG: pyroglutamyl-peptidase I [Afipia sp.]|nr:pyroglutamyl-peptidase I [Afipia sp.]OJW66114.1 MAG: peptidase C15 [Afipia sp. 64-13]
MRLLLTGFEAFPGAPYNPTGPLVERLLRLRRPALENVERIGHIFPVTYEAVDSQLPALLAQHRPDALLMFGLATRTPYLRIETRARNTITQLWPDAGHTRILSRTLAPGADATRRFGPHTAQLLRAAQQTGIDARASLNAGAYLCNYLSWRALEAAGIGLGPRLAAFVHVPLVPRHPSPVPKVQSGAITFEHLVDAGEALMMIMVKLARHEKTDAQI